MISIHSVTLLTRLQDLHTCFSDIQNLCLHSFSHIFDILSFLIPYPCNSFTQNRSLLNSFIFFSCIKPKLTLKNFTTGDVHFLHIVYSRIKMSDCVSSPIQGVFHFLVTAAFLCVSSNCQFFLCVSSNCKVRHKQVPVRVKGPFIPM